MMADPQNLETDVLIVGAGPVGLIAANALVEKSIDMGAVIIKDFLDMFFRRARLWHAWGDR